MITQKPRILIRQDGRDLAFCHLQFRKALSSYVTGQNSAGRKLTKTELRQNLADHLCLSEESINNYAKGYNGPANIEVVQKMAAYLKMDWIDLMKEVPPMSELSNKKIEEMENELDIKIEEQPAPAKEIAYQPTDFERMTTWNAVRDIFKALQVFVMFFEDDHSVILDLKDPSSDPIIRCYHYCWTVLHKNMLDIPDSVYNDLENLITELQYWIYGLPLDEYYCDPDEIEENVVKLRCFGKLYSLRLNDDFHNEYSEWAEYVTSRVLKDYYSEIRRIFKNYIPREPVAGRACPQSNDKIEEK